MKGPITINFLLHNQNVTDDEIHIRMLSAKDEIIVPSPNPPQSREEKRSLRALDMLLYP
ncbi:OmpA family protein [Sesbania bispinosa]|nr:OmpA family protein [Sesbania bispinosa]